MAWKWYDITEYKASVGGNAYYGGVQLLGPNFYAALTFHKSGALPASTAPVVNGGQRFYAHLDFQQMPVFVDILRNEKPLRFGWDEQNPNLFHMMSSDEPIGEGDGRVLAGTVVAAG
jgi:hypothetical protein